MQPPEVRDLKSWLKMYGEPSPDKIPTGFLTTFRASKKVMAAAAGNASARQPSSMKPNALCFGAELLRFCREWARRRARAAA